MSALRVTESAINRRIFLRDVGQRLKRIYKVSFSNVTRFVVIKEAWLNEPPCIIFL